MNRAKRLGLAVLWISVAIAGAQASSALQSVAKAVPEELSPSGSPEDVSAVFLSEDLIAVLVRSGPARTGASHIGVFRLTGSKLELVARVDKVNESDELYAAGGKRVIVAARFHKYLYSGDLKPRQEIPYRILSGMFPRSGVIGEVGEGNWRTYQVSSPMTVLKGGVGQLLSVSDEALVFRLGDEVKTETAEGRLMGSVSVGPDTRSIHVADLAGKTRLLINDGNMRITDLNGKQLLRIHQPEGWGFRWGWSSDGTRMLFDHFTRMVPFWDRAIEKVFDGIGFVMPEEANGETIRVIDSVTGKTCFSLDSPGKLLGQVGGYHADLSPSGRLVVVSTLSEVTVYRVPEVCSE